MSDWVTRALVQPRRLLRGDIYGLTLESTAIASISVSEAPIALLPRRTFSKAFSSAKGACHFVLGVLRHIPRIIYGKHNLTCRREPAIHSRLAGARPKILVDLVENSKKICFFFCAAAISSYVLWSVAWIGMPLDRKGSGNPSVR